METLPFYETELELSIPCHPLNVGTAHDADSEGHEGKFFVWTPEEIRSSLGGSTSGLLIVSKSKQDVSDAALFMDAYAVTERGNFEGKNILNLTRDVNVLAEMHRLSADEVERKLAAYTGQPGYVDAVEGAIGPLHPALAQAPTGFARL